MMNSIDTTLPLWPCRYDLVQNNLLVNATILCISTSMGTRILVEVGSCYSFRALERLKSEKDCSHQQPPTSCKQQTNGFDTLWLLDLEAFQTFRSPQPRRSLEPDARFLVRLLQRQPIVREYRWKPIESFSLWKAPSTQKAPNLVPQCDLPG